MLRLRPKLHRFDLSPCLLQTYHIDNESIKWSLSIIVQICDNNHLFLVCLTICYQQTLVVGSAICRFLLRNAMISTVYAVIVCLSVSVCVLCVCVCICHTPVLYQNS